MLTLLGNDVRFPEEPVAVHSSPTVDNQAGLGREGTKKVEGFGIGGRQRTGRMVPIGQVEVKPEPRHKVCCGVTAALELPRLAGRALQRDSEVEVILPRQALASAGNGLPR